jgi:hypothetical protein
MEAIKKLTAKMVDEAVKKRNQPMGKPPKGGMPFEDDMGPLPVKTAPAPTPNPAPAPVAAPAMKKGGKVKAKKMASGGNVRGCGCESKGKTKGRFI